jgi:hypothetical protein
MTEEEFEPARRELCPDDACIGLIGPDGRCKVCGTVGASAVADPRHAGMQPPARQENGSSESESELDEERELCPDDACIGIIGPDGRCKECGKRPGPKVDRAEAEAASDGDEADDDDDRELCPDDNCIGLMGADGRCKVCGTARASSAS